ncbi:MAG: family 43 glycosylhydrolase [Oscillospiraceae bacterium]
MKYKNPILRGMYPDPSVCRANDKYYMVCSTFQYFPAVPIFESDDMVNWKQIGHCLTRDSQIDLGNSSTCGGIYAPTIRYHEGRFYMVTTDATTHTNFYVYTDDIYSEWSEPIIVQEDGIDPTLYFDNGKTYFINNGFDDEKGCPYIRMCEIDINTGKKLSESKPLWYGTGGRFIEAPHMYKFGEYYYILDAEGGTEYGHMVNYGRSKNLWGPFEPFPQNPVLTNRNLGGYILQGAGHGDILEDKHGNWWFVHLAFRQINEWQQFHHLGRETCLVPITWKDNGWFYIGDGTSKLEYNLPNVDFKTQELSFKKTFETLNHSKEWCYLRNYVRENYQLGKDFIKLTGTKDNLFGVGLPTFIGIRQSEFNLDISVTVKGTCQESGLTIYMDEKHHYDLFIDNSNYAILRLNIGCISKDVIKVPINDNQATLMVKSNEFGYNFSVKSNEDIINCGFADSKYLSSEVACGFTGVMVALYSVDENNQVATFTDLNVTHIE